MLAIVALPARSQSDSADIDWSGHLKYQAAYTRYPADSVFRQYAGSDALDHTLDSRFNFSAAPSGDSRWDFNVAYQLMGVYGDGRELPAAQTGLLGTAPLPSDRTRLFDLADTIEENDDYALVHRLDRFNAGYTGEKFVARFGRQAISWGNGLLFTPMDIFNPFDPTLFDKEYKTGDDMLYSQYLRDNGHDIQLVSVFRRDPSSRDVEAEQGSLAVKYHALLGSSEFGGSELDLLAASHYDDTVLGIGGNTALGGAVVSGDIVYTDTGENAYTSYVAGLSYSWVWWEKNFSGIAEFYHNDFGLSDINSATDLLARPDLLERIERGELYALGRDYLAMSVTVELTPLFLLTPNIFANLHDSSALVQLSAQYNWKQNLQWLFAASIPTGSDGSEFRGIRTGVTDQYFSYDAQVLAKLSWYF